jgi:hypothetical protein
VTDAEIRAAVAESLAARGDVPTVGAVRRRPSAYRTSFPIEEVDVELSDGSALPLVLKDTSRDGLTAVARAAKPHFLHDPLREIDVYRSVLPDAPFGPPAFFGAVADPKNGRYRLLVERVAGRELYQVGEFEVWQGAARWLAALHTRFANRPDPPAARLLTHDAEAYRVWSRRAADFARGSAKKRFAWLAERYDRVIDRLLALPPTLLHGEFYASNVLVADTPNGRRVSPVDWEVAGWGPGALDLAALTAGGWTDDERTALARAYHDGLGGGAAGPFGDLLSDLDWCRLHAAVRWVGWSAEWSPPSEHARDWSHEAVALAERVGL